MTSYRDQAELHGALTDYWTSELFLELKAEGQFDSKTDLGFLLTTDGVQVFKAKTRFSIWLVVLECLYLPPVVWTEVEHDLHGFHTGSERSQELRLVLIPSCPRV